MKDKINKMIDFHKKNSSVHSSEYNREVTECVCFGDTNYT